MFFVLQVDWAEPEHEVDEETMSTVKILFVRNLMLSTSEATLRDLFNRLGNNSVERVKKAKDYAFVHFSSREAAEQALSCCKNLLVDEAEVEVVWSKPVDKQTYNTRKTLTKVFTSGMGSDTVSPRRRGAAGIRGLGAPGTAPPKQLVQRFAGLGRAVPQVGTQSTKQSTVPVSAAGWTTGLPPAYRAAGRALSAQQLGGAAVQPGGGRPGGRGETAVQLQGHHSKLPCPTAQQQLPVRHLETKPGGSKSGGSTGKYKR